MNHIGGTRDGFESLTFLVSLCTNKDIMVEVGVYTGESLFFYGENFKRCIGVDPWKNGYPPGDAGATSAERAYPMFLDNLKEWEATGKNNIEYMKLRGDEACLQFEDNSLDFVYIDAEHTEKGVADDIKCWYSKVKIGGVIAGHDYDKPGIKPGVDGVLKDVLVKGMDWYIIKTGRDNNEL